LFNIFSEALVDAVTDGLVVGNSKDAIVEKLDKSSVVTNVRVDAMLAFDIYFDAVLDGGIIWCCVHINLILR